MTGIRFVFIIFDVYIFKAMKYTFLKMLIYIFPYTVKF